MSRLFKVVLVAVFALALVVSVTGCDMLIRKGVEEATGVKVDENDGTTTLETPEGKASTTEGKLPDGFPSDVPIYQPSTIKSGVAVEAKGKKQFMVGLQSSDAQKAVYDWYKSEIAKAGWELDTAGQYTQMGGVLAAKKGDQQLAVTVGPGSEGAATDVFITVGPQN